MYDDDLSNLYETTELKMSNDSDSNNNITTSNNNYNVTPVQQSTPPNTKDRPSKNGFYVHSANGGKTFGASTGLLILAVLIATVTFQALLMEIFPLGSLLAFVIGGVTIFKGILGGK